jgi:predicted nucleic acid-binding protein
MAKLAKKPRVLIDANVLFAGSAFPRWPYEVMRHALRGDFQSVLCLLVIDQARTHLHERYPQHLDRFENFLLKANYELIADPTAEEVAANHHLNRDVSDVAIALVAKTAGVDYVVSEDKDLTAQDESTAELRRFTRPILSGTFLREVMGWTSEELEAIRHRRWSDMPEVLTEKP